MVMNGMPAVDKNKDADNNPADNDDGGNLISVDCWSFSGFSFAWTNGPKC
jgi:hypothetical protein